MYINFEFVMVTTQILETYVSVFGFKRQVEQGITSFYAHFFGIFDDFSKWSVPKSLRDFAKSSNMIK